MTIKLCEQCHHLYVVEIRNGNVTVYKQGVPIRSGGDKTCVWCGAKE